jgi:hypothetical protein
MNIVPPSGNFAMEVRYAIDDRHRKGSLPPYAPAAPQSLRAKPSDAARSRQKWARSAARALTVEQARRRRARHGSSASLPALRGENDTAAAVLASY